MNNLPPMFWATVLAAMGTALALIIAVMVACFKMDVNIALAVIALGSNLVSGALGAFAGHSAATKADVTTGNAPVTINQGDSK